MSQAHGYQTLFFVGSCLVATGWAVAVAARDGYGILVWSLGMRPRVALEIKAQYSSVAGSSAVEAA